MNLTIDIGNTCTKIIVFNDTVPVYRNVVNKLTVKLLRQLFKKFDFSNSMISSVVNVNKSLTDFLKRNSRFEILSPSTRIPVKNRYKTPATLGNDRLANVIAASFLFPGKNVLVIDAGTCIKYDFINVKKHYLGGSISPGLTMRFKALNHYTGKLPLVKAGKVKNLSGTSTLESIQTGVQTGIEEEILGFINLYKKKYKSVKVVLTGGDAFRFAGELKISIFAAADLVNIGLNEIIRFNN